MTSWMDTPEQGTGNDACVRRMGFNNVQIWEGGEEASPRDILKDQRTENAF